MEKARKNLAALKEKDERARKQEEEKKEQMKVAAEQAAEAQKPQGWPPV